MKMKEIGPRGAHPWRPLRSATAFALAFAAGLHVNSSTETNVTHSWKKKYYVSGLPCHRENREFAKNIENMFLHREFTTNMENLKVKKK